MRSFNLNRKRRQRRADALTDIAVARDDLMVYVNEYVSDPDAASWMMDALLTITDAQIALCKEVLPTRS